ncbi:MAG: hypothetical protein VKQ33_03175 [Candidatus Sericytochromatia bacterium]|nr:hypothetical protein [Candidatus Sericytochromatia bacterium]
MRRSVLLALVTALVGQALAGCGALPAGPLAVSGAGVAAQGRAEHPAAAALAATLRGAGWRPVRVQGPRIAATTPGGQAVVFDLTASEATGLVLLRCDGVELAFPLDEAAGATDEVATALLALTAQAVLGGAEAFVAYWVTHRGDAFDRRACTVAVLTGMVLAVTTQLPVAGHVVAALLTPIVQQWIERWLIGPRAGSLRAVLRSARELVPAVRRALAQALATRPGQTARSADPTSPQGHVVGPAGAAWLQPGVSSRSAPSQ